MAETRPASLRSNERPCSFCKECDDNEALFGIFYTIGRINCHHFCLLLSTKLTQNGKDKDGVLGFLYSDIVALLKQASKRSCYYCGRYNPTVYCAEPGCSKLFHLPCGRRNGALNLFHDRFQSYCINHRVLQRVPSSVVSRRPGTAPGDALVSVNRLRVTADGWGVLLDELAFPGRGELRIGQDSWAIIARPGAHDAGSSQVVGPSEWYTCGICYDRVTPYPTIHTIWPECCKGDRWFHRLCVAKLALSAGRHYVKCPLCNNQPTFLASLYKYGFYVPDQDASWEREAGAFRELHERPKECYMDICLSTTGRNYLGTKRWQLVICGLCGSQAAHRACAGLPPARGLVCSRCRPDGPARLGAHPDSVSIFSKTSKAEEDVSIDCISVVSSVDVVNSVKYASHTDGGKEHSSFLSQTHLACDDSLSRMDSVNLWRKNVISNSGCSSSVWNDSAHEDRVLTVDVNSATEAEHSTANNDNFVSLTESIMTQGTSLVDDASRNDLAESKSDKKPAKKIYKRKPIAKRRSIRTSLVTYAKRNPNYDAVEENYLNKNGRILRKRAASMYVQSDAEKNDRHKVKPQADCGVSSCVVAGDGVLYADKKGAEKSLDETAFRALFNGPVANPAKHSTPRVRPEGEKFKVKISPVFRDAKASQRVRTDSVDADVDNYFRHLELLKNKKRNFRVESVDSTMRFIMKGRAEPSAGESGPERKRSKGERRRQIKRETRDAERGAKATAAESKPCPKSKKTFYIESEDLSHIDDKMDLEEEASVKYKIIDDKFAKVITSHRIYTVPLPKKPEAKNRKKLSPESGQRNILSYFRPVDTKKGVLLGDEKKIEIGDPSVENHDNVTKKATKKLMFDRSVEKDAFLETRKKKKKTVMEGYINKKKSNKGKEPYRNWILKEQAFNGTIDESDRNSARKSSFESCDNLDESPSFKTESDFQLGSVKNESITKDKNLEDFDQNFAENAMVTYLPSQDLGYDFDANPCVVDNRIESSTRLLANLDTASTNLDTPVDLTAERGASCNLEESNNRSVPGSSIPVPVEEINDKSVSDEVEGTVLHKDSGDVGYEPELVLVLDDVDVTDDGLEKENSAGKTIAGDSCEVVKSVSRDDEVICLNDCISGFGKEQDQLKVDFTGYMKGILKESYNQITNKHVIALSKSLNLTVSQETCKMSNDSKTPHDDLISHANLNISDGGLTISHVDSTTSIEDLTNSHVDSIISHKDPTNSHEDAIYSPTVNPKILAVKSEPTGKSSTTVSFCSDGNMMKIRRNTKKIIKRESIAKIDDHFVPLLNQEIKPFLAAKQAPPDDENDCVIVGETIADKKKTRRKRTVTNYIEMAAERVAVQNVNFLISECSGSHAKLGGPEGRRTSQEAPVFARQKFNQNFWNGGSNYLKTVRSDIENRKMARKNLKFNKSRAWYRI